MSRLEKEQEQGRPSYKSTLFIPPLNSEKPRVYNFAGLLSAEIRMLW
jgi:hypothetical protein